MPFQFGARGYGEGHGYFITCAAERSKHRTRMTQGVRRVGDSHP
jgi:hypothetical protein